MMLVLVMLVWAQIKHDSNLFTLWTFTKITKVAEPKNVLTDSSCHHLPPSTQLDHSHNLLRRLRCDKTPVVALGSLEFLHHTCHTRHTRLETTLGCRQDKLHWSPLKASRWGLVLHNWRQRCDFRILCNILNSRRGQLRPKVFWLTQFVLHRLRLQNSLFDYLWLNNLIDTLMSHLFKGRQWTHMITATWSLLSILWCSLTYWMLTIRRILLNWFSLVDSARLCHLEVLLQEWWRNQSSLAMFGPRLGRNWSTHEYLNQVDFFRDSQMGKGFSL